MSCLFALSITYPLATSSNITGSRLKALTYTPVANSSLYLIGLSCLFLSPETTELLFSSRKPLRFFHFFFFLLTSHVWQSIRTIALAEIGGW